MVEVIIMNVEIIFVLSFFYGILSAFSPCILPIIPIFVGHSLLNRTRDVTAFIIGFFLIFTIITILTVIFTAAINYYLNYFKIFAAILIIIIGIFFIVNKNIFNYSHTIKHKNVMLESFLFGFLTSLAWFPCISPYMMTVIALSASTGNWILSTVNMILYYAGFSFILVLIAILASKIKFEKLIKHTGEIRIFSGILIIIAGVYLLLGYL